MRFSKLEDSDKEYIAKVHSSTGLSGDEKLQILYSKYGVCERTVRRWLKKLGLTKSPIPPLEESSAFQKARVKELEKSSYYIITWAQNATPVHTKFWQNLLVYAEFIDAKIHVIAGRYKNPTSTFADEKHDWWSTKVLPYLDANRHDIHPLLTLLSDIKVQPTASMPLSGFNSVSGVKSAIIGHPSVHLESLPVLE